MDIWKLEHINITYIDLIQFSLYQRLNLQSASDETFHQSIMMLSNAGGNTLIDTQTIGTNFYLFTLTGSSSIRNFDHHHLLIYQLRGVNQFELITRYRIEGALTLSSFWYRDIIYLAVGSSTSSESVLPNFIHAEHFSANHAQILASMVRSSWEDVRYLEGQDVQQLIEQMKDNNRRIKNKK